MHWQYYAASLTHTLQVRRKDPTGEWKWRLLQLCVDAKQADPRYLSEELHLEFCGCLVQHLTLWQLWWSHSYPLCILKLGVVAALQ